MHANLFLTSHWRPKIDPCVFVIMPFSEKFQNRFKEVFVQAINNNDDLYFQGEKLHAYKVDLKNTGDCLHTKILSGIAHSALILADISTVYRQKEKKVAYRNSNVMYEVGLALACRQQNEVIIVKDDEEVTPFDINSITYEKIDFKDIDKSINKVHDLVSSRLSEVDYFKDVRVQQAYSTLSMQELRVLKNALQLAKDAGVVKAAPGQDVVTLNWAAAEKARFDMSGNDKYSQAIPLLLNKGLIEMREVKSDKSEVVYQWTLFGCEIAEKIR